MTVGSEAIKLLEKGDQKQGVIDTQREMQKGYVDELIKCAKRYDWKDPFYICVQTRRERLLSNVIRCQFYARQTKPTPQYDLACYKYDPKDEKITFEWVVPDKETIEDVIKDSVGLTSSLQIDPQLRNFCIQFHNKTLQ